MGRLEMDAVITWADGSELELHPILKWGENIHDIPKEHTEQCILWFVEYFTAYADNVRFIANPIDSIFAPVSQRRLEVGPNVVENLMWVIWGA